MYIIVNIYISLYYMNQDIRLFYNKIGTVKSDSKGAIVKKEINIEKDIKEIKMKSKKKENLKKKERKCS